jgi:hypothetical protein
MLADDAAPARSKKNKAVGFIAMQPVYEKRSWW